MKTRNSRKCHEKKVKVEDQDIQDGGHKEEIEGTREPAGISQTEKFRRPNRDYTRQNTWTLNKSLYKIYEQSNPNKWGYTNRMKEKWDNLHPKLNLFTAKHLNTQITRIIKKKLIRETGLDETTQQEEQHNSHRKVARTESETGDGGSQQHAESLPTEGRVLENILEPENQNSDINTEQKQQEILPPEELEEIRSRWEKHFETVYNQNISERKYQTKLDRKVNQKLLNTCK